MSWAYMCMRVCVCACVCTCMLGRLPPLGLCMGLLQQHSSTQLLLSTTFLRGREEEEERREWGKRWRGRGNRDKRSSRKAKRKGSRGEDGRQRERGVWKRARKTVELWGMQLGREIDACLMPRTPLAIFLREVRVRQSAEKPEPGRRKGNDRERRGGRPFLKYDSPYNHNTHTHIHRAESRTLWCACVCLKFAWPVSSELWKEERNLCTNTGTHNDCDTRWPSKTLTQTNTLGWSLVWSGLDLKTNISIYDKMQMQWIKVLG